MNDNLIIPQTFKVFVRCITFNQSGYITDTLTGFAMQQTDFPYICVVVDDASTDGEQGVIKKWCDKECSPQTKLLEDDDATLTICYQHKNNPNCYLAFYYLKKNTYLTNYKTVIANKWRCKADFEAFCEGDDYWIDTKKLQKQVYFMENNPDYSLCYGCCYYYYQDKNRLDTKKHGGPSESFELLIRENTIPTLTVLYRTKLYAEYLNEIKPYEKGWKMGDYPMWLYFSYRGKVKFMNEVLGVYRFLKESASHSPNLEKNEAFIRSTIEIRKFFVEHFNVPFLFDNDKEAKYLFANAIKLGELSLAKEYYKKINKPSKKEIIKYCIIKSRILYKITKGFLFYSY